MGEVDTFSDSRAEAILLARMGVVNGVMRIMGDIVIRRKSNSKGEDGKQDIFSLPEYKDIRFKVEPNEEERSTFFRLAEKVAELMCVAGCISCLRARF